MQLSHSTKLRLTQIVKAGCVVAALGLTFAGNAFADDKP